MLSNENRDLACIAHGVVCRMRGHGLAERPGAGIVQRLRALGVGLREPVTRSRGQLRRLCARAGVHGGAGSARGTHLHVWVTGAMRRYVASLLQKRRGEWGGSLLYPDAASGVNVLSGVIWVVAKV